MNKPRIFLGSSGKQEKLLQALERGLVDVANVEPWTTSFNPGKTTLERLLELTHEVDFAAFVGGHSNSWHRTAYFLAGDRDRTQDAVQPRTSGMRCARHC